MAAKKIGAGEPTVAGCCLNLNEALVAGDERGRDFVVLDDALKALGARKGQVVELRFFG